MAKRLIQTIIAASLGWAATQAPAADGLPDPTRPPLEAGAVATGASAAPDAGPVLQSVKIAAGRRTAVISGQVVAEGERFGTAKVVGISESEVVLLGPEGRQTLKLFPGVEKRTTQPKQEPLPARGKHKSKRHTEQKAP